MADLSALKPTKDVVELIVRHPTTGEPLFNDDGSEMTITFHAPHTRAYRSAGYDKAQAYLKANKVKDGSLDMSFEEMEDANLDLYAAVTVDWDITYDGKKPKLTKAKAKQIYTELFWLKPQIEEALAQQVDFTNV